jgi:hypothetical protein
MAGLTLCFRWIGGMDIPNNQSILPLKKKATFEFYNDKMQS